MVSQPDVVTGCWLTFLVTTNRPRCHVCTGPMKRNGTTTSGTSRWRCKDPDCGSSTTHKLPDKTRTGDFCVFHAYVMGTATLSNIARRRGISRWTLDRRFTYFWLIDIPNQPGSPASTTRSSLTVPTLAQDACLSQSTMITSSPGTGLKQNQLLPTSSCSKKLRHRCALYLAAGKARTAPSKPVGHQLGFNAVLFIPNASDTLTGHTFCYLTRDKP